ncbi:Uncharacterised protein [Mycobacteroides abscessus subsp. massiliense]|nr:Uncharacterised protein [Mycobacteroides abscessus subsp. massiliense]
MLPEGWFGGTQNHVNSYCPPLLQHSSRRASTVVFAEHNEQDQLCHHLEFGRKFPVHRPVGYAELYKSFFPRSDLVFYPLKLLGCRQAGGFSHDMR